MKRQIYFWMLQHNFSSAFVFAESPADQKDLVFHVFVVQGAE